MPPHVSVKSDPNRQTPEIAHQTTANEMLLEDPDSVIISPDRHGIHKGIDSEDLKGFPKQQWVYMTGLILLSQGTKNGPARV